MFADIHFRPDVKGLAKNLVELYLPCVWYLELARIVSELVTAQHADMEREQIVVDTST